MKRALDILIAGVALVFLCPVLMLAALMIRLDSPGPVIFRQQRVGRGGSPFRIYKFRTMRVDPVAEVRQFVTAEGTLRHKVRQDPRVTRVGRMLRKTSLDELPQLLNVLRGDMSLIGPRPELVQIVGSYEAWQHGRHLVRPGITGWWQVSGRSDKPMHEHTELDLYYVEHLSPSLDVRILLRTVRVVLCGSGAF
jgi:exopolysaccharide biosynthesis polyprenyl glycosylphosphotransferase